MSATSAIGIKLCGIIPHLACFNLPVLIAIRAPECEFLKKTRAKAGFPASVTEYMYVYRIGKSAGWRDRRWLALKCPNCSSTVRRGLDVCPACGYSVVKPEERQAETQQNPRSQASLMINALVVVVLIVASVVFFGLILYNGYYWFDNWQLNRVYASGAMTAPDVEPITLADGRVGHAITFYGSDGDELFVPQLGKTYLFTGGFARIEVPDSQWFDLDPNDVESAIVSMFPMILEAGGDITRLPELQMEIAAPVSPLTLINPSADRTDVITSVFPLEIQVVPKSKVLISGEDVSDIIDVFGHLVKNINVYPVGDNNISIYVDTPNHKQTRRDIVLHRAHQSINLEPSQNMPLPVKASRNSVTISGSSEPGATIVVDTKYVEGSLKINASGNFEFQARMGKIGENIVTFHATMPGREDTYLSIPAYYVPDINTYSRSAWRMDYAELKLMGEQRDGQVYECKGPVIELLEEAEPPAFVMDVAPEGAEAPEYVVLVNESDKGLPEVGKSYRVFADASGTEFYGKDRCPRLIARYILE